MRIASVAEAMQMTGRLSLTARTVDEGTTVIGVHGDAAPAWGFPAGSTETVYVAAAGRPLPVSEQVVNPKGGTATYTFSEWGKPLQLIAPPDPVPITSFSGLRQ